jgi:hypothetical protein
MAPEFVLIQAGIVESVVSWKDKSLQSPEEIF